MHEFSRDDMQACLFRRRMVFVGDSTLRQLFWAAAARLDRTRADQAKVNFFISDDKQRNLSFEAEGVTLDFIFDPWLNSSSLVGQLARFRQRSPSDFDGRSQDETRDSAALMLVAAPGLWASRHGGYDFFGLFKDGVEVVEPFMQRSLGFAAATPKGSDSAAFRDLTNHVLMAPVPIPYYDHLSPGRKATLTPGRLEVLNRHLDRLSPAERSHVLFAYNQMTGNDPDAFNQDGLHVPDRIAAWRLDLALNVRCNAAIASQGQANKLTCCVAYPSPARVQRLLLLLGIVAVPVLLANTLQVWAGFSSLLGRNPLVLPVLALTTVACYCYLADRTHFLSKSEMRWSPGNLVRDALVFMASSIASAKLAPEKKDEQDKQKDPPFLSKDQVEEWKGLLAALILISCYNGGNQSLAMHKAIRLFVSMFVFLSTYGHTTYFLKSGDFSLQRVLTVIADLNAMPVFLAFAMNTQWTAYYFFPMITFWFIITWLALRIFKEHNDNPAVLSLKIAVALVVTNNILLSPFLDALFGFFKLTCGAAWDAERLRLFVDIDRFVPYVGMLAAATVHRFANLRDQPNKIPVNRVFQGLSEAIDKTIIELLLPSRSNEPVKPMLITFSIAGVFMFLTLTQSILFPTQDSYNAAHPYLSCFAVISLFVLRNCHKNLRRMHLALPAKLGGISLETYLLQHHILLSGDGTGMLKVGLAGGRPGWVAGAVRTVEAVVIAVVFLWACGKSRDAASRFAKWLVGGPTPEVVELSGLNIKMS
jgi:N-acetylneuraminate 9-O-acetyltransferase